jgi:hypothetical protein
MPKVEREEFLNVGVILYCKDKKFLQAVFKLNEERLRNFSQQIDIEELKEHLCSFKQICRGGADAGPIGKLDIASRFRWLTGTRSTIVQTSKVHPGLCNDPLETLIRLHKQLAE